MVKGKVGKLSVLVAAEDTAAKLSSLIHHMRTLGNSS